MEKRIDNKTFILIVTVVAVLFLLSAFGLYECPFRYLFGVPCPTCGITRAIVAVLKLDFKTSFYYYAIWPIFLIALIVYLLFRFDIIKLNKVVFNTLVIGFSLTILIYYILRHVYGSPVVQVDFQSSLLYRIISCFK